MCVLSIACFHMRTTGDLQYNTQLCGNLIGHYFLNIPVLLLVPQVSSQNVGLYGKQVVSFQCAKSTEPLPSTSISTGEDSLHI